LAAVAVLAVLAVLVVLDGQMVGWWLMVDGG